MKNSKAEIVFISRRGPSPYAKILLADGNEERVEMPDSSSDKWKVGMKGVAVWMPADGVYVFRPNPFHRAAEGLN